MTSFLILVPTSKFLANMQGTETAMFKAALVGVVTAPRKAKTLEVKWKLYTFLPCPQARNKLKTCPMLKKKEIKANLSKKSNQGAAAILSFVPVCPAPLETAGSVRQRPCLQSMPLLPPALPSITTRIPPVVCDASTRQFSYFRIRFQACSLLDTAVVFYLLLDK